jgi:hypothetical protein
MLGGGGGEGEGVLKGEQSGQEEGEVGPILEQLGSEAMEGVGVLTLVQLEVVEGEVAPMQEEPDDVVAELGWGTRRVLEQPARGTKTALLFPQLPQIPLPSQHLETSVAAPHLSAIQKWDPV